MKINRLFTVLLLCLSHFLLAQEKYSRVKIYGNDSQLRQLGALGLPVDHGEYKKDTYFMTDLSASDIEIARNKGYICEIIIDDVQKHYIEQNLQPQQEGDRSVCPNNQGSGFDPLTPSNFKLGSMAGFYTYQEFLDELDSMRSKFPNLISGRDSIDSYLTYEGNPIFWLRISDNPDTDEAEEEILYTSIHHAREPASLSQLILYMWYLLENYGSDDEITYLVDNNEMYFVPMINPDGYIRNETTNPSGGGMHRKNRNPVSGGTTNYGVDLNRNYGYHWDESGTSNDPNNDTWPGTAAFSEVETQAMRWFVENHNFKFALNAHTYGNLLLYPVGWAHSEIAPHADYFEAYTEEMVKLNGYNNMKSSGLYPASGDSDDWMYIDDIGVNGKDTIYALTPEVSNEGTNNSFWPPSSAIEDICKGTVFMNKIQAHLPHIYGAVEDISPNRISVTTDYFHYSLRRLGLTNGAIQINMTPLAGIQSFAGGNSHTLNLMEVVEDSIAYSLNTGIQFGDDIIYVIERDNGMVVLRDTVYKKYGLGTPTFTDDGTTADNWTGSWSFTNEDYVSPDNSITDSPFVNYSNSSSASCEITVPLSLKYATYAYVNFWAKWDIEDNYDYVQFMISTDGGNSWTPLCGKYTNAGSIYQDEDQPVYDGTQTEWVFEEIDLTDYLGEQNVLFKFQLQADQYETGDGFYFDDFALYTDGFDDSGTDEFTVSDLLIYPNPTTNTIHIKTDEQLHVKKIVMRDNLGKEIKRVSPVNQQIEIDISDLAEGMYFVTVITEDNQQITRKVTVIK
ncbi:MAG: M14 family zinc carboxypeptidase [Crocinitomicaceae bacterium]